MKQEFDEVVREQTGWLLAFVRQSVRNPDIAEDLVQEIFIKAYRRYDSYEESGKLRGWLKTIARNTLRNYYASPETVYAPLSLDVETGENGDLTLSDLLPDDAPTPEEALLHKELVERVMRVLAALPPEQRMVLTYRYIDGLTVEQTALRMGIPQGSVKSSAHYALQKMRGELGIPEPNRKQATTRKGDSLKVTQEKATTPAFSNITKGMVMMMNCTDAYRYLFQYALEKLPAEVKADVAKHVEGCPACRDIVTALRNLIPHLPKGRVGEITHYNIHFPSIEINYSNSGRYLEKADQINAVLEATGGVIPEGEINWEGGFTKEYSLLGIFDTEGEEMEYEIMDGPSSVINRYTVRKARKAHTPIHWERMIFRDSSGINSPKNSYLAPNLYIGSTSNALGNDANSGIYVALPKEATNIRIKRGNGVIDCGPYQFVYSQRYVLESETLWLEYTYNM